MPRKQTTVRKTKAKAKRVVRRSDRYLSAEDASRLNVLRMLKSAKLTQHPSYSALVKRLGSPDAKRIASSI